MCGRLLLKSNYDEIKLAMALEDISMPNLEPSWNVAPTQDVLVARMHPKSRRRVSDKMHWGLIPAWAKEAKMPGPTFNAVSETIDQKPTFRDAWRAGRRCLVIADGFYEWRKAEDKQPFLIRRKDRQLTVMAGIWEIWGGGASGEIKRSCTILTTAPNALITALPHDRMPVILDEADWAVWLGDTPGDDAAIKALMKPCPADAMELWPVDARVGDWRNNDARLMERVPEAVPLLL